MNWFDHRPSLAGLLVGLVGCIVVFGLVGPVLWLIKRLIGDTTPLYYRQTRYGKGRREFTIWKFTTLPCGTDKLELEVLKGGTPPTRLGRVMRPSKLDELPQMLNLMRGDIRFFGPRPNTVRVHDRLVRSNWTHELVLRVEQGLVCLAHLMDGVPDAPDSHLAARSTHETYLAWHLYYIEHRSPWFNLRTFVRFCAYMWRRLSAVFGRIALPRAADPDHAPQLALEPKP